MKHLVVMFMSTHKSEVFVAVRQLFLYKVEVMNT